MASTSRTLRSSTSCHEFSEKLGGLRPLLGGLAKLAPSAASEVLDEWSGKATAFYDSCEGAVNQATHAVVKSVKEHPVHVAIAAVCTGLIAWWLLSRRYQGQ